MAEGGAPPGSVNLATLSVPQLRSLQTRLTSELEHLTTSHTKLRAAQAKFRDCVRSITDGVTGSKEKGTEGREEILVPLTSSLYVKGRLTDREKVLVDVGTGFYIEKTPPKAIAFYDDKVKGLDANLQELEKIVSGKSQQLRVVEEVLRQKMLAGEAPEQPAAASA
ncbi:hypothetical protein N7509_012040 [Penicillium cosmopolitanum]|uniref:Prefoldin subunit 5 n=1 Tax=Penicillium cosmopolitanum TaxID=1131564 RepID=A0A9W9SHX2_9EURO|nr:uncharacterized protein N7509_012040 [Penicillium cosmopolitanum]KAJ5378921.1 hypothetical protein N7509_012040 [Penicillium cosmopolitanum]